MAQRGRPRKNPVVSPMQKMSVDERQSLQEDVKEREEIFKNVDGLSHTIQDSGRMAAELERKKGILSRDEDMVARGKEKDRIARRIREIEEAIIKDRPTSEEMNLRLGTHESDRAVQKNIRFHQLHAPKLMELQSLRKRLEPEDPRAQDLEYARPDTKDKKKTFFV